MSDPSISDNQSDKKPPNLEFHGRADRAIFNFGEQSGISSTGDHVSIHQEVTPAQDSAQLLEMLQQCHAVILEARNQGAAEADCDTAVQAVNTLQQATKTPSVPESGKSVSQAMSTLESVETSFGKLAGIGESFQKILKLLGPVLHIFFGLG